MIKIGVGRNLQSICDNCFFSITCESNGRGPALDADLQACVCWDANLRRSNAGWKTISFKGTSWQRISDERRRAYLLNSYRVLLTRARQGMVVFVPPGDAADPTRAPDQYDRIFEFLSRCGFARLEGLGG